MSHRPLALVSGLTLGDYLLWNWSLNGNHDVLALVSGLTLPPLAVACLWLLALTLTRVIARSTRRSHVQAPARRAHAAPDAGAPGGDIGHDRRPRRSGPRRHHLLGPSPGKLAA